MFSDSSAYPSYTEFLYRNLIQITTERKFDTEWLLMYFCENIPKFSPQKSLTKIFSNKILFTIIPAKPISHREVRIVLDQDTRNTGTRSELFCHTGTDRNWSYQDRNLPGTDLWTGGYPEYAKGIIFTQNMVILS